MSKRLPYLFILLVMVIFLVACGGDVTATPAPLTQNFVSSASGISLQYPADWVASDLLGQVIVANFSGAEDTDVPAPGQFQARLFVTPISVITGLPLDATSRQIIEFFAQSLASTGATFNPAADVTVGGHSAARIDGSSTDGQAVVFVIDLGEGNFLFASATSAPGELARFEPTLRAILTTITYTSPEVTPEATP